MAQGADAPLQFLGMESNPDVMTKLVGELGLPAKWSVNEVFGLEPDLLSFVPAPTVAVILLFPSKPVFKECKAQQKKKIDDEGQKVPDNLFFLKQGSTLGDACGTIALIHSVANNVEKLGLADGPLKDFIEKTKGMDPIARGEALARDTGIHAAHSKFVQQGQTSTAEEGGTGHHFTSFTVLDGDLFELDGSKGFPVNRGPCGEGDLLIRTAEVIRKEWMDKDPEEVHFCIMAIGPQPE
eukprot:CAMPEP_0114556286 /NCGR_PEP_ID=MMETSP0114-20121206/9214_1 /TAXON_ID=31324 /ORGANISM="Goniomonas sp, Strain m" /LENGTH=238 /DNA_ID=CAMNT_0001741493 /DNA_START=14 /DNA_END=730 /DNA_ORIENTATION=+